METFGIIAAIGMGIILNGFFLLMILDERREDKLFGRSGKL